MFEQATPSQARRGAAFARHLPKATSPENNKAPDIAPGAEYSMISCFDYLCLSNSRHAFSLCDNSLMPLCGVLQSNWILVQDR